jgi:hypothetical protein
MDTVTLSAPVETPDQALVAHANQHHGKTGFLIRLGAYGFLFATIAASFFVDWKQDDAFAITAVGGTAYLVLAAWSLLLSARALRKAERAIWPVSVILFTLVDISTFLVVSGLWPYRQWNIVKAHSGLQWLLDGAYLLMLPVIVPFLTLVLLIAVPAALLIIRRSERKNRDAWTRPRRWRWGVRIACILALPMGLVLLPPALFLFCATAPTFYLRSSYQPALAASMPQVVKDSCDSIVDLFWSAKPGETLIGMRYAILAEHASEERLLHYTRGTDGQLSEFAWQGLIRRFRSGCCDHVADILVNTNGAVPTNAAYFFVQTAKTDQIIDVLGRTSAGPGAGRGAWIPGWCMIQRAAGDPEFLNALNNFLDSNPTSPQASFLKKELQWLNRKKR